MTSINHKYDQEMLSVQGNAGMIEVSPTKAQVIISVVFMCHFHQVNKTK